MDRWQAIDDLWNGYSIPAYDENSVPDDAEFPYITYEAKVSEFEDAIPMSASVWYYSSSWKEISNKVDEILSSINPSKSIPIEGGYMYIYPGTPFAQRINEPGSDFTKRMYILINVEFMN